MILLLLTGLSCQKSAPERQADSIFPPNMKIYYLPMEQVWQGLLTTLKTEFLYNLEITNPRDHFFSTELIRDELNGVAFKYRLTGTLKFEGSGIAVVLYRQIEIQTANGWVTQNSDYSLEHYILQRLTARLKN